MLLLTISFGLAFLLDGAIVQGVVLMAGGVALTVSLFGLAARRERKLNLSSPHTWYLDRHNIVLSGAVMAIGALVLLVSMNYAMGHVVAIYMGGFGAAVIAVAFVWFLLSLRD